MRVRVAAVAVLLVVSATTTPAVGPGFAAGDGNEAPLADAGLDQTVERGTTVYLDASGSRDPDGNVTEYEWTIRTSDGDEVTPACASCARTRFTPSAVGTYEATVTVTDDDGATASDTLYVRVEPGESPSITVSGPTETTVGSSLTYTAEVGAGTASLSEITWRADGEAVRTEEIPGSQRRFAFPYAFVAEGGHDVVATVTDADGLSASDSLTVTVEAENTSDGGDGGNTSPGDGTPGDGGESQSIAEQVSPIVAGEQLLTGEAPFGETYQLQVDTAAVVEVVWWRDGHRYGTGAFADVSWTPGRHTLYAVVTYADGSTDTARFAQGGSEVTVDPEPNVELSDLDGTGGISGSVDATDAFGNLREVSVAVDGEEIVSKAVDPVKTRTGDAGRQLALSFDHEDVEPGEHIVEVRARDARGQVVEYEETVEVVGPPEIISAEFVNGPVDSYHPRIDAERYTAKHVLTIDLNGVDPEDVRLDQSGRRMERLDSMEREIVQRDDSDRLKISTKWAARTFGKRTLESEIELETGTTIWSESVDSTINITPSPPEIRVDIIHDGTPEDRKDKWGLTVDLSNSFDPDGSALTYNWKNISGSVSENDSKVKFDSNKFSIVTVRDGQGQQTKMQGKEFLYYFTPRVSKTEVLTQGPYKPNDTVRLEITTEKFKLPKKTYYDHTEIDLRVAGQAGRSDDWGCWINGEMKESVMERHNWSCDLANIPTDPDRRNQHFYNGTVAFEASAFADGAQPNVTIANENRPDQTARTIKLPYVTVLEKGERIVSDAEVEDTSYLVEQPEILRQEAVTEQQRDALLTDDFSVKRTEQSGTKYTLERREKVQEAVYDTETRTFHSRGTRSAFLDLNPEWEPAGENAKRRNYTTTETEWRSSKGGTGTFTGNTREVKVEGAEYRTERKYRHTYTVERTGTRRVTHTQTVRVPVTRYRTVERCNKWGCYMTQEPYTVWETRTQTYTTTETYTYTTTESSTYWSTGKRHADHTYTGQSRRIETDPAEYETQYQYEYEQTHEEWVYSYTARHREQVQPAKYEWQPHRTTRSEVAAESAAMDPDVRIADEAPARIWVMTKQTGTTQTWKPAHPHHSEIVETEATVTVTVLQEYFDLDGDRLTERDGTRIETYTFEGYLPNDVIITEINETEVEG